jgi:hypothetical protein
VAQLGARLDGIEEVVGSNPIGSTSFEIFFSVANSRITLLWLGSNQSLFVAPTFCSFR